MQQYSLITIVETQPYLHSAENLLSEQERENIKDMIARNPECGVLMKGTGGVRKTRIGVGNRGKSSGARVIYFYHNDTMPVYLLTVFPKARQANLTKAQCHDLKHLTRILKG